MRETFPVMPRRPYTIYNCAMSLDGRTATVGKDSAFSGPSDWGRVHALRDAVEGICVGIGTVLVDDPKLRVKVIDNPRNPHRIVVDSMLRIPVDAQLLHVEREGVKVIVGTTTSGAANVDKVHALEAAGATVVACGTRTRVDLHVLWDTVKGAGINSVLLEGGGTLAWSMLEAGLVDEVRTYTAPYIVGGPVPGSVAITMGSGHPRVAGSFALELVEVHRVDDGSYSRHLVKREQGIHEHRHGVTTPS